MEDLKNFLFALMTVSIAAGAVNMMAPEGRQGSLKKQICFASAIAMCAALLTPLCLLIKNGIGEIELIFPEVSTSEDKEAEEEVIRRTAEILCGELEYEVKKRFEIENPSITLFLDSSDRSAIEITGAHLSGSGSLNEAADYIAGILGCPVTSEECQ